MAVHHEAVASDSRRTHHCAHSHAQQRDNLLQIVAALVRLGHHQQVVEEEQGARLAGLLGLGLAKVFHSGDVALRDKLPVRGCQVQSIFVGVDLTFGRQEGGGEGEECE